MTAQEAKALADKYKEDTTFRLRRKAYFLEEIKTQATYGNYSYTIDSYDFNEEECQEFEKLGYKVKRMVHKILLPSGADVSERFKGNSIGSYFYDGKCFHKIEHIYEFAVISWGEDK